MRQVHKSRVADSTQMKNTRYLRVAAWKEERLSDAFAALVRRAKEMNLAVDINEKKLYSPEHGRTVSLQEFQSLMRHDLAEHFEGLPSKDRNKMIAAMWSGFIKASVRVAEEGSHPHLICDLETIDAYRIDKPTPIVGRQAPVLPGHGVLQCDSPHRESGMPSEQVPQQDAGGE